MFMDFVMAVISMAYPVITRWMINDFVPNRKLNLIIIYGALLLLLYIFKAILKYLFAYYGHVVGVGLQKDMRKELFEKYEKLPFSYYDNNETGSIMSRMTTDLFDISELAHHGPENLFMAIVMMIFSLIYLGSISLPLTIMIFSCVPIMAVITNKMRKMHLINSKKAKAAISKINAKINSSISGIRVTKAFNNAELEGKKFDVSNDEFVEAKKGQYYTMSLTQSSTMFITELFNVLCLICGGIYLYRGDISFGDYSAFMVSINVFINPILNLVNFTEMFHDGIAGFERFCEIMDQPVEVDKKGAEAYKTLKRNIKFNHVSFNYETGSGRTVLDDVSFSVKKGKTIALVGPSGGGKTTICHLLPKFYHVVSGEILIDGKNIEDIETSSLRHNIGIVQQDVFLFGGTFYDNILYGRLNANKEEVYEAAKKANIYDYIMSLPNGFDTEIGERGIKLSGGQKQRLSIARVFLKNPEILILDEATSALDNTTEVLIQESLNTLKEGRTTIVVAHRLSTIKNADEIIVIANGKIKEHGTHDKLVSKKKGLYKELYKSQFKNAEFDLDSSLMMS